MSASEVRQIGNMGRRYHIFEANIVNIFIFFFARSARKYRTVYRDKFANDNAVHSGSVSRLLPVKKTQNWFHPLPPGHVPRKEEMESYQVEERTTHLEYFISRENSGKTESHRMPYFR